MIFFFIFIFNFYVEFSIYIKFHCESDYLLTCVCGLVRVANTKAS